nr:MAG TPA: hypothetical protein [Caudoviricetes sp.]
MAGHTMFFIAHIRPIPINDSIPITIVIFTSLTSYADSF